MRDGKIWSDSLGQNPYAKASWIGCSHWDSIDSSHYVRTEAGETAVGRMEALMVSVPPAAHQAIIKSAQPVRATATFLPWGDSGVGLVTWTTAGQGVVAIMDIAGRSDLGLLQAADARGRVCACAVSDAEPGCCPWLPVLGLSQALNEASNHRRLAAKEFVSAIEGLRWLMRSPALYAMLGVTLADQEMESVTLSVCQPL